MTDDPRVHHLEHRVAQYLPRHHVAAFLLLDQHEELHVPCSTSPCERAGGRAADHRAQIGCREGASDEKPKWLVFHRLSPCLSGRGQLPPMSLTVQNQLPTSRRSMERMVGSGSEPRYQPRVSYTS